MSLPLTQALRNRLLRIDSSEVLFERRGFETSRMQDHMEFIGETFLFGYHMALEQRSRLMNGALDDCVPMFRGFAYEGAAMALGICDCLSWRKQSAWQSLLGGAGSKHPYILHVGLGWTLARIPWCRRNPEAYLASLDPLLRWLVLDGFGFHEGYFHWNRQSTCADNRFQLSTYGKHVFDQGLGRSLWFVSGGSPSRIAAFINSIAACRRPDFWSGIGLALAYAGNATVADIQSLLESSGIDRFHLAQGTAFGAEARELAGITNANTELVCELVCGMPAAQAAELTYVGRPQADVSTTQVSQTPLYEVWRTNIRNSLRCQVPV